MHPDALLVVEFLNTVNVEKATDVLNEPDTWRRWAAERGLRPGAAAEARETRDALRAAIGDPRLPRTPLRAAATISLTDDGPALVAEDVTGAALAAATRLVVSGDWERIKICPADDCLYAFHDLSRNRSRTWCSMRVCGNREKARVWRERTTTPVDA
ncbi:CGNR zinc finger domain-containing protein [Amycolatopsis sp. H20-H5]|uniref:CGNR zinc finger domain-containing protein n=1 Tax=Amycolatopsis sp. H20-H5 TaxID=3046309 RepID=UPI002DB664FB|nr:CGNR zinc finger domain-containing protein [Amycolatopsis sp. H20-H5]MEC3975392.1 CGNR zinc finger domain-containing protein [Amycolatopsis sp. H20-H5]